MANMKQNLPCSRSKPPPARSACYGLGRSRNQLDQALPNLTMQSQDSLKSVNDKAGSMSSSFGERMPSIGQISTSPKEISECLSGWLSYLQMMNGLCSAGSRLSHALGSLVQDTTSPCHTIASQCYAAWEELVKATATASTTVKNQVLSALQELSSSESDSDLPRGLDTSQQVVCGSLMTFINLQYQFSLTCCEFLGAMANSNCCQSGEINQGRHDPDCCVGIIQQCYTRLYSPVPPVSTPGLHRIVRSPLHFPLCNLQGPQRRWSEAAAGDVSGEPADSTLRRWSMPWESNRLAEHHSAWHGRLNPMAKLAVPSASSQDRSRSTTPDSVWHGALASQEELQEVIQLLSCRPGLGHSTQLYHPSQHLPGVTLTSCPYDGPPPDAAGWSESTVYEERLGSGLARRGSTSPQSVHLQSHHSYLWGEQEGQATGGDTYPSTLDPGVLASRKSSSSTDSSSSHSLHSRSTTGSEGGTEVRSHLYSMWSGSELAFMKLPESNEPTESNQEEATGSQRYTPGESQHQY